MQKRTSFGKQLNKFNFHSSPLANLTLPPQIKILSLEVSENGCGGVIFIQIVEGSFIVKPSMTIPTEIFFNTLAGELGLRVPKMDYFTIVDPLYHKILYSIEKYCAQEDECLFARIKTKFNHLFFALIQYIPSISYENVGASRFNKMIQSAEKLHELGTCLGFDMIINNQDRLQLIWGGEGNINNILIQIPNFANQKIENVKSRQNLQIELSNHVLIDNQGHMCNVQNQTIAKNIRKYLQKILQFLRDALTFLEDRNSSFMHNNYIIKFMTQLYLYTGYQLKEGEITQILIGIEDILYKFISIHKQGKIESILQKIKSDRYKINDKEIADSWVAELQKINLNYCDLFVDHIKPILKQFNKQKMVEPTQSSITIMQQVTQQSKSQLKLFQNI